MMYSELAEQAKLELLEDKKKKAKEEIKKQIKKIDDLNEQLKKEKVNLEMILKKDVESVSLDISGNVNITIPSGMYSNYTIGGM